ncbi:MAG: enolase C-terminal domain-like protein [Candidatus Latescibacterota bacterium]
MRVTEVRALRASRFMYVKVETDEGLTGLGELHPASGTGGTPYLPLAGGITNVKKIAALAEASYAGVAPHNPLSCVLTAACVQLCAAVHNVAIQEYPRDEYRSPKRDLVHEPLVREGGYLLVPQTPGLGIELNEEALPHYPPVPYERPPLLGPDGGLRDY